MYECTISHRDCQGEKIENGGKILLFLFMTAREEKTEVIYFE